MKQLNRIHNQTGLARRDALKILATTAIAVPAAGAGILAAQQQKNRISNQERWLSAQGRSDGSYGLGSVAPAGQSADNALSGFRGHGVCQQPQKPDLAVFVGRRPATRAIEVNVVNGNITQEIHCAPQRYMQGHGVFSADGQFLFTTESDTTSGAGKIVVRRSEDYKVVNEFDSHGIGPHELHLMPDGKTLAVANGGLLTHPDSGRKVLNLDTMRSTLSYIDSQSGRLISEHSVSESKASIRHFDVADDGTIAFGMQVQRQGLNHNKLIPLAGIHKQGSDIQLLHAPETLTTKLSDYMGSVTIDSAHRTAGFTSPRGDLAVFWNIDDLSLQQYHSFHDVCGLALSQNKRHFVLSNSSGKIRRIDTRTLQEAKELRMHFPDMAWDNHMLSVKVLG